tara:strand:- start:1060 stop:2067 length:1008 start_codon:yes stop_codon:yes gene_type:complete
MAELSKTAWIKRAAEGFVKHAKEGLGFGATHPKHIEAERLKKIKKDSIVAATKAWYARQKAGKGRGINIFPKGPVPEVKPKTLRPTAGKEGMGRWTTEEDKIAGVEAAKSIAAKKAALAKVKKKGEKLKADRDIGMGRKKSSGSFVSPKVKKREESLKKRYTTKTAGKKVKLGKSRYHIKNPDSTKEVIYDWDAKKNKFVVKKGRPKKEYVEVKVPTQKKPKRETKYQGERPPRTESGKLAKTDPAKKRVTKEQQLEKTGRGPSQAKKGRRVPPKKDPRTGKEIDYTAKGKGLKRPSAPKTLPPSKKKPTKKTQPKHYIDKDGNLRFYKNKKKKD